MYGGAASHLLSMPSAGTLLRSGKVSIDPAIRGVHAAMLTVKRTSTLRDEGFTEELTVKE